MRRSALALVLLAGCRERPTTAAADAGPGAPASAASGAAPSIERRAESVAAPRLWTRDPPERVLAPETREELRAWIEDAPSLELVALGANRWRGPGRDERPRFHGLPSLGSAVVDDPASKRAIADAYARDAAAGPGALCFEPRHAIRARRGDQGVDIVICYTCRQQRIFDESTGSSLHPMGTGSQALLDRILREKGVAVEQPEPLRDPTEVEVRTGTLPEDQRIAVLQRMNGVVGTCHESAQLWRPHAAGELQLDVRLPPGPAAGGQVRPVSVKLVVDTTPPGFGRCVVREALASTVEGPAQAVDLRVRYAVRAVP